MDMEDLEPPGQGEDDDCNYSTDSVLSLFSVCSPRGPRSGLRGPGSPDSGQGGPGSPDSGQGGPGSPGSGQGGPGGIGGGGGYPGGNSGGGFAGGLGQFGGGGGSGIISNQYGVPGSQGGGPGSVGPGNGPPSGGFPGGSTGGGGTSRENIAPGGGPDSGQGDSGGNGGGDGYPKGSSGSFGPAGPQSGASGEESGYICIPPSDGSGRSFGGESGFADLPDGGGLSNQYGVPVLKLVGGGGGEDLHSRREASWTQAGEQQGVIFQAPENAVEKEEEEGQSGTDTMGEQDAEVPDAVKAPAIKSSKKRVREKVSSVSEEDQANEQGAPASTTYERTGWEWTCKLKARRLFPCDKCRFVAIKKDHLKDHKLRRCARKRERQERRVCPVCGFKSNRTFNLRRHFRLKHKEEEKPDWM